MVIRMLLKELLIQYEVKNDKSHVEVAKEVGVSLSTYYRWLNGESLHLKKRTIDRLSEVLHYDINQVVEESARLKPILGQVKRVMIYMPKKILKVILNSDLRMVKKEITFCA